MKFAYGELQSEASRKMNDKKWFKTFQDFGMKLNEPLAELYIYSFLSDRTSPQYAFYLEDLKNSTYYDDLLQRLNKSYPNTIYSSQYASELASDKYMISSGRSTFTWPKILFTLLFTISFIGNIFLIVKLRRITSKQAPVTPLTQQEQKIAQLICQDKSNKEIADELFVSVSTVKSHINNIYKKLNVQSRMRVEIFSNKKLIKKIQPGSSPLFQPITQIAFIYKYANLIYSNKNHYVMKATLTLLFCISFGMLIAQSISLNSEITTPGETPYLVGKIDKNRLTGPNYKSWFNSTYNSYQPDNTILASLSPNINQYKIQIFIGTWCVDSRREVPRFIKILENSKFSKNQLEIIALDYKPGRS